MLMKLTADYIILANALVLNFCFVSICSTSCIKFGLKYGQLLPSIIYVVYQRDQCKNSGAKVDHTLIMKLTPDIVPIDRLNHLVS